MTLIQLQYFQALACVLHYTKTSEMLHISQPSLSYSISELEKELGVPMFKKAGRKISLTKHGEIFLPYTEKALDIIREGQEQLKQLTDSEPYTVRLGYFYSISATLVPSLLENFYRKGSKKIQFHFTQELSHNIVKALLDGGLDLAFTLNTDEQYGSVPIMTQPLYLVVPEAHHLASREFVTIEEFFEEPQVMLDKESSLRNRLDDAYRSRGFMPHPAFEVKECSAAIQFVALNLGLAVLPRVPSVDAMPVKMIPILEDDFIRTVYFSWPLKRKLSSSAEEVKNFIIGNYGCTNTSQVPGIEY